MKMIEWLTSKLPDRAHVRSIIFGMNTPTGRLFDILLLCLILLSVIVVSAESTVGLSHSTRNFLHWCEWVITIVFTIEYILRIYCLHKPWRYILSFYGIIDLISILPSYIALIYSGAQVLMVLPGAGPGRPPRGRSEPGRINRPRGSGLENCLNKKTP